MPRKKKVIEEKAPEEKSLKKTIMQNIFDNAVIEYAFKGYIEQSTYAIVGENILPLNVQPTIASSIEDLLEKELDRLKATALVTVGVGSLSIISPEMKKANPEKYKDITKLDQLSIPKPVPSFIVVFKEKNGSMAMLHSAICYDMRGTPYPASENYLDNIPVSELKQNTE